MRTFRRIGACGLVLLGIGSAPAREDHERDRFNDYLEAREHERDLYHREVHRHRLDRWQRERLEEQLEYERKLDRQARRDFERARRHRDEFHWRYER